jgi:hypothetical protein
VSPEHDRKENRNQDDCRTSRTYCTSVPLGFSKGEYEKRRFAKGAKRREAKWS